MALKINTKFGQVPTSQSINDKVATVFGGNTITSGFNVSKKTDVSISVSPGACVIKGASITEDIEEKVFVLTPSMLAKTSIFVSFKYEHEINKFTINLDDNVQADNKILVAEVLISNSVISSISNIAKTNTAKKVSDNASTLGSQLKDTQYVSLESDRIICQESYDGKTEGMRVEGKTVQNLILDNPNIGSVASQTISMPDSISHKISNSAAGTVDVGIKGNTLRNLVEVTRPSVNVSAGYIVGREFNQSPGDVYSKITVNGSNGGGHFFNGFESPSLEIELKPSTTYTIFFESLGTIHPNGVAYMTGQSLFDAFYFQITRKKGMNIIKFTTKATIPVTSERRSLYFVHDTTPSVGDISHIANVVILEGDHTGINIVVPYFRGITSIGEKENNTISVNSCGKNLLDIRKYSCSNNNDTVRIDGNKILVSNKVQAARFSAISIDVLGLVPGKSYSATIDFKSSSTLNDSRFVLIGRENFNPWDSFIISSEQTGNKRTINFVAGSRKSTRIEFMYQHNFEITIENNITIENFQLEEGNTSTAYEQYTESKKIHSLSEPLRGLPGGVCDEITANGELIRRVGVWKLTATEPSWRRNADYTPGAGYSGFSFSWMTDDIFTDRTRPKADSNKFIAINGFSRQAGNGSANRGLDIHSNGNGKLLIESTLVPIGDIEGLKTWLAANPTTVYYELKNPTITKIDKPRLSTFTGQTNISTSTAISPILKMDSKGDVYDALIRPNTKYSVKWVARDGNSNLDIIVGGAKKTVDKALGGTIITTPSALIDNKLCVSGTNTTLTDVMLVEGESDQEIYTDGISSAGNECAIDAVSCGKNLFNISSEWTHNNGSTVIIEGDRFTVKGIRASTWAYSFVSVVLKKNTVYALSFDFDKDSETEGKVYVSVRDSVTGILIKDFGSNSGIFNTIGYNNIRISFYCSLGTPIQGNVTYSNVTLSESYALQEYVPHRRDKVSIQLAEPLRSLPSGVKDEIVDGVVIRRVGKVILNGSDNNFSPWTSGTPANTLNYYINDAENTNNFARECYSRNNNLICSNSGTDADAFIAGSSDNVIISSFKLHVAVLKSKLSTPDIAGLKLWLLANPTTIYYELATPKINTIVNFKEISPLPNGVKDEVIDNKIIERVGRTVLNGSENWVLPGGSQPANHVSCYFLFPDAKYYKQNTPIAISCDKFKSMSPTGDYNAQQRDTEFIATYGSGDPAFTGPNYIYLSVLKSRLLTPDLVGFKKWLSENNVTVDYELAIPKEKKDILPSNINVNTYSSTTYISTKDKVRAKLICKAPTNLKAIIKNTSDRIREAEHIVDKMLLPAIVQCDFERTLLEFDYTMDQLSLEGDE